MTTKLSATWAVLDIDGTLTATSGVHGALHEYARPRLGSWIDEHRDDPEVAEAVAEVKELGELEETATTAEVVAVLHGWMAAGDEYTSLETLLGLIWQRGYAEGELTTELFPDVAPALRTWQADGVRLAVFAPGSVAGQIASFGRTTEGDLTALFEQHYDTVNAGPKAESSSYLSIAIGLGADPSEIVFLSDTPAELDAAADDGWQTVGLKRKGEPAAGADFGEHLTVSSLDEIGVAPA